MYPEKRGKTRAGSIDPRTVLNDKRRDVYLCRCCGLV